MGGKIRHAWPIQLLVGLTIAIFLILIRDAKAASFNYLSATNLYLSSPNVTFIVATGSVADALTVNATSVTAALSPIRPEALSPLYRRLRA